MCGRPHSQIHHIVHGTSNRAKSDYWGLIIPLCQEHHTGQTGVHKNNEMDLHFKRLAQEEFEKQIGDRQMFIREFGKSYL